MFFKRLMSRRHRRRRDIFAFWDGTRTRKMDPLPAWGAIWADPECSLAETLPAATRGEAEAIAAIVGVARRVFDLQPYKNDDEGTTDLEALEILYQLIGFMHGLKKKHAQRPIMSQPSESNFSTETNSTTQPSADSSCSENESTDNEAS